MSDVQSTPRAKHSPVAPGQVFGRLTVISRDIKRGKIWYWICRCECGTKKAIRSDCLRDGASKSCGCLRHELHLAKITTHGGKGSLAYGSWMSMRRRCLDASSKDFFRYGGNGVTVCERWKEFANFLADMGERPSRKHTLDRFPNNEGNYEPGNCRWATWPEQQSNKRTNHIVECGGMSLTLAEWSKKTGILSSTLRRRLAAGWSVELTLASPSRRPIVTKNV